MPSSFAGSSPEDSVFLGREPNVADRVAARYNNSRRQSGVDVVRNGRPGHAQGPCCADVTWSPGDRFAAVFVRGTMSSWVERDGTRTRLRTASADRAVDASTVASRTPAFGVRMGDGSLPLTSVQVLQQ